MKKLIAIIIGLALVILFAVFTILDDYKAGRGMFMSTATYREYVREGKR